MCLVTVGETYGARQYITVFAWEKPEIYSAKKPIERETETNTQNNIVNINKNST